ncbi:histidine phosphatase family protein [Haloplasma contractile]|uniref:Phosphoglycerate mutase protein n=1 Tax=Haloplasma contractile SSD-17B TaxID=1033810 RepID=F7Q1B0_9MOLU|nr:histidine phosphatase family protein [Haloplasma contractile]ERJ12827.1 phosphoglycerate mutase protein [Haloplasma contractile SSD-17B]
MTVLALVRHGETDWNKNGIIQGRYDIPLNERGKKQAAATAKNFSEDFFDLIVASPLVRAVETAEIIAEHINYDGDIITNKKLIERDFGIADGKPVDEFIDQVRSQEIENLELEGEIKERVSAELYEIAKEHIDKKILVVCHSHVIKAALSAINPKTYNFKTKLNNCSISLINYKNDDLKIKRGNFNDHYYE